MRARPVRRRILFAGLGALISLGGPLALSLLRSITLEGTPYNFAEDVREHPVLFLYVGTTTAIAFISFGYALGVYADKLAELSTTDALTSLANRRGFLDRLERERSRARRYAQPLSLVLIDVDKLKEINDRFGHRGGDEALRRVASAIRDRVRASDLGARHGGDEFAVVAPHTSRDEARALAERIRALVDAIPGDAICPKLKVSFGLTTMASPERCEDLLSAADRALYEAKKQGGDRVVSDA